MIRVSLGVMNARRIRVSAIEDEMEACFDRGWSDGLPVVPPTEIRVYRMLQGTKWAPDKVVGVIPPNRIPLHRGESGYQCGFGRMQTGIHARCPQRSVLWVDAADDLIVKCSVHRQNFLFIPL